MRTAFVIAILLLAIRPFPAHAQTYPQRPITVVVPYPPGGTTDNIIRITQKNASALLGQPIIIENRPGATGNIGGAYVARAKPDGYTLVLQATIIGVFPLIFSNMLYDPLRDYAAITGIAESPTVFAVRADGPYKTLGDFAAAQKTKPRGLMLGNTGAGAPAHLAAVQLAKLNNFNVTHIPYKGTTPEINDLLGGQIDMATTGAGGIMGQIQGGLLRVLAVASPKRSSVIPDVPTTKEAGFAEMNGGVRYFLGAPAGTPAEIVDKLAMIFHTVLRDPEVASRLKHVGFDVVISTPQETQAMLQEQHDVWAPIVKELSIKLE